MDHESTFTYDAQTAPGVTVRLRKMTFGRRLDLLKKVGDLAKRATALSAGTSEGEQLDAELAKGLSDKAVVEWGLEAVSGLRIDTEPATPELLIERGPEELVREILGVVQKQLGLSETEIKN